MPNNSGVYIGLWWLPDSPNKKISGSLEIMDSLDGKLLIQTNFNGEEIEYSLDSQSFSEINGVATKLGDKKDYSFRLYNCMEVFSGMGVLSKIEFFTPTILVSTDTSFNQSHFSSISCYSEEWGEWIKADGLEKSNDEALKRFNYNISYKQPDPIDLYKGKEGHIYIFYSAGISFTKGLHEVSLRNKPFLVHEFANDIDIKTAFSKRASVERFFMVMMERPLAFSQTILRDDYSKYELIGERKTHSKMARGYRFIHEFLPHSNEYLSRWFEIEKDLRFLVNTFFFAFTDYNLGVENTFLNYVFGLELYHKKRVKAHELHKETIREMYEIAFNQITHGGAKSWFEKIASKEVPIRLKRRLRELVALTEEKKELSLDDAMLQRIVDTRNYLVHLDEGQFKNAFSGKEYVAVNDKLAKLTLWLLRREIVEMNI